jgi:hypothetical protein
MIEMTKNERIEQLKSIIDNCLDIFETEDDELNFDSYCSCGLQLSSARDELKEIMSSEEYDKLEQQYRYWTGGKPS